MFLMGSWNAPWNLRFNPFMAASGKPFDITLGQDVNGDSFFNDRASFGQVGAPDTVTTSYGTFNLNPAGRVPPDPDQLRRWPQSFHLQPPRRRSFLAFGPKVASGGFNNGGFYGGGGGRGGGHGPGALVSVPAD